MKRITIQISILLLILFLGSSDQLFGQFFKIYGYLTPDASEKEVVYWLSYIPSSDHQYSFYGKDVDRKGLMAHSLEVEYGITNNFTVALYFDYEHPAGESFRYTRAKAVMAHYRFFDKKFLPVDLAVYFEYILPYKGYKDSEEIEFKLIMEKDLGFNTIVLNPTFEKKISGEDVVEGVEFALNGGYYYRKSLKFQPGLEYYSKMGHLQDISPYSDQKNYIFPAFDFFFGKNLQFNWHLGVGIGLTDPTDNVIVKSIFSYEFF